MRENLNAMAVRLGQMQAQLLRLDTLGERLAKLAGFRPQDLMFGQTPGQGGAVSSVPSQDLSLGDLTQQLEALTRQVDDRGDKLGVLESLFTLDSARKKLVPTMLPVAGAWHSSELRLAHRSVHRSARVSRRHRFPGGARVRRARCGGRRGRLLGLAPAVW